MNSYTYLLTTHTMIDIIHWSHAMKMKYAFTARFVFYRATLHRAPYCHAKSSVRHSVSAQCPSVTLRYRGHIGWNTSTMISWPINGDYTRVFTLCTPQHNRSTSGGLYRNSRLNRVRVDNIWQLHRVIGIYNFTFSECK